MTHTTYFDYDNPHFDTNAGIAWRPTSRLRQVRSRIWDDTLNTERETLILQQVWETHIVNRVRSLDSIRNPGLSEWRDVEVYATEASDGDE